MRIQFLLLSILGLLSPALAEAESWDWRVTPFLWAAGIDGEANIGSVSADIDVGFDDILDDTKFGALLHIETHQPSYGFYTDIVYLSLDPQDSEVKSLFLEGGVIWKLFEDDESGLEFGARYYDQELTLDLPNFGTTKRDKSWTDGIVGFRWVRPLGNRWSFMARGNVGAGGSDLSWSLTPTFFRTFDNGNRLVLGVRTLDVDFDDKSQRDLPFGMDVNYSGLIIGYTFD